MTNLDLDELERLHEAATPGPWVRAGSLVVLPLRNLKYPGGELRLCPSLTFEHQHVEPLNAALIAAMRNALPELLRLARRARRLEEAIKVEKTLLDDFLLNENVTEEDFETLHEGVLPDMADRLRTALAEEEDA